MERGSTHKNQINRSKVAAFTAKWLVRHAPIQIIPSSEADLTFEREKIINSANALFALQVAFRLLKVNTLDVNQDNLSRLLYHLKYRQIEERALFGWLDAIAKGEKAKKEAEMAAGKGYSVFVASPDDCIELRERTKAVLDEINREHPGPVLKLNYYMWDEHKAAGATTDYQGDVFKEAEERWGKAECDILIVFVWYKFGPGTKAEFERYIEDMIDKGGKKVIFCGYAGAIPFETPQEHIASREDLRKWIADIESKIAPLGRRRGSINSVEMFGAELARELRTFLRRG